ncbi:MAG: hypothetical protein J5645_06735 [Lachnospiraceae bacterium]|nr:hypothetical protein [Lachnospiraceae bacterium]
MKTVTRKQRFVWAVICICVLAAIGGVIFGVLRKMKEDEANETIWVVESRHDEMSQLSVASDGTLYMPRGLHERTGWEWKCEYDDYGRLVRMTATSDTIFNDCYDLEYYYLGDTPITRVTHTDVYTYSESWVSREQHEYYPSGVIRSSAPYWDEEHKLFTYREFYDEEQKLVRWESYDNDGNVESEGRFTYDSYGHRMLEETRDAGADEWSVGSWKSDCDDEGRVIRMYRRRSGTWLPVLSYEYNTDGTVVESQYVSGRDDNGEWMTNLDYIKVFDRAGRTVRTEAIRSSRNAVTVYTYGPTDEQGFRKTALYNGYVSTTEYDRDNHLIFDQEVDPDGKVLSERRINYDKDGRLLSTRTFRNGVLVAEDVYDYSGLGNLTSIVSLNGDVTYFDYIPITISKEQAAENAKFYMDFPTEMETIPRYRDDE